MNPPEGMLVDHINGNGLDNRRENLRLATQAQNLRNRGKTIGNTTGFKGVSMDKRDGRKLRYIANIKLNGKTKFLGAFMTGEEAHAAYCAAAKEIHGEFARFN